MSSQHPTSRFQSSKTKVSGDNIKNIIASHNNPRELFLQEFVMTIIKEMAEPEIRKIRIRSLVKRAQNEPVIGKSTQSAQIVYFEPYQTKQENKYQQATHPLEIQGYTRSTASQPLSPSNKPSQQKQNPELEAILPRIILMLSDPSIRTIECLGPEKPLLVTRNGAVQTSNIILSKDEVSKLMHEISEKTKIPLITGVFKAILSNFHITAIISDFTDTRFLIHKILQQLQPPPFRPIR